MKDQQKNDINLKCKESLVTLSPCHLVTLSSSYAWCERLARRQAGNFYHAFRLLPAARRRAMCALYAFMRVADDLSDGPEAVAEKSLALADWRRQFDAALAGVYHHPLHPAFHHTVEHYRIPRRYLEDVLDGVSMDLDTDHYDTFADLYRYCYRVASAVGLACIHIWGFADARAVEYAESAGIALQLTNILARSGRGCRSRTSLFAARRPRSLRLSRRGSEARPARRALPRLDGLPGRARRRYYESALPLAKLLDPSGRAVFLVMLRTYRGLLEMIARRDYDVFSSRVRLSRWRKLWLAAQVLPLRWRWG